MSKYLLASAVLLGSVSMTGCYNNSAYAPGYNSDYVYSVGYYGYRPFWGGRYYSGYGWGNHTWFGQPAQGHYYNRWYGRVY